MKRDEEFREGDSGKNGKLADVMGEELTSAEFREGFPEQLKVRVEKQKANGASWLHQAHGIIPTQSHPASS